MKSRIHYLWVSLFALLFMVSVAHAQTAEPEQPTQPAVQSNFSQPELDQMLAPIALYPDGLLSQILMASSYSSDVVQAARWSRNNPDYKGEAAVKAVQSQPWDISVKSLLAFPQVLSTMSGKIEWTERLGQAFQGQQQQVMDTIQSLRQKAMAAGYLKSDNRISVTTQDQLIVIEPVVPTQVYVPYYNPTVVYGTWWAPAYAPVYWAPWPGYAVVPGYYGWAWSPVATIVTAGLIFGAFNWHHRHAYYHHHHMGYWGGHRHSHYRVGRTGTTTRWTRDSRRPVSRVSGTRTGARTGTRTVTRTGTRTGARTGTRTGTRTTTRTTTRSTTGARTGTRSTGAGGAGRMGGAGGARAGGAGKAGGGHKSGH